MGEIYLTKEGYKKLLEELNYLKTVKRREISKAIEEARAHGDISENAEYESAKEAQALNEKRIAELEAKLSQAQIIEDENLPKDQVVIGSTVKLKNLDTEEEIEYTLVSELEADFEQRKISVNSPVGRKLLGHKEGEIVEVQVPVGILRYKILKISK
ncbi:MAG: transcription elongation factor GreA [Candidatus Omnitrophica bacterium]|nr:transcription elongation factor GreA [Candidatus Omnitrophota bacterium]